MFVASFAARNLLSRGRFSIHRRSSMEQWIALELAEVRFPSKIRGRFRRQSSGTGKQGADAPRSVRLQVDFNRKVQVLFR